MTSDGVRDAKGRLLKGAPPPPAKPAGRKKIYTDEVLSALAENLENWVHDAVKTQRHFLLGDWCFANKVIPYYIRNLVARSEEFKEAWEYAKAFQEHMITKGALLGKFNARFSQFMLLCVHDWSPKLPQDPATIALGNDMREFTATMREAAGLPVEDDENE